MSVIVCSRPFFSRATRPASSSTRTCLLTAGNDMSNGVAISVTLAGPFASRVRIARRVGSESAPKVVSRCVE